MFVLSYTYLHSSLNFDVISLRFPRRGVSWPFGAGARADALNLHRCAGQVFFAVGVFCSMLLYNVFIVALPLSFFVPAWERVRLIIYFVL